MMRSVFPASRPALGLALLAIAACSKPAPPPAATPPAAAFADLPIADTPALPPQHTDDPNAFVPLRSVAVKDAIHLALRTGQTQRWADGKLTGYAVPSAQTDAHGCRAVRYTVDQRAAGAPFESINACDANPDG